MALTKARRAELEAELLRTMDRQDALKVELREALADHREQVKLHATKLKEIRDILSGREGEQTSIPGAEIGSVKPPKQAAKKPSLKDETIDQFSARIAAQNAKARRPKREIIRWRADATARKVPNFVVEMTGLKTKAAVIARYGENALFEKAKPLPKPVPPAPPQSATPKDGVNTCRGCGKTRHRPGGALTTGGYCWACHTKRQAAEATAKPKADHAPTASAEGQAKMPTTPKSISWTEGDGTLQAVAGTTTYRVREVTPTRWVVESKSERERAWHKEDVLVSLLACEALVMQRHPGFTFAETCLDCGVPANLPSKGCDGCQHGRPSEPLDDLVGSRADAVARHEAGKAAAP